jgi:mono/diheme cytochrome c family protein
MTSEQPDPLTPLRAATRIRRLRRAVLMIVFAAVACVVAPVAALAQGRGAPPPPIGPRPFVGPPDRPPVDPAAADRGRGLYAVECVTCHGPSARGTDNAPSLIRSITVLNDRYGSLLGPFFKKGHPMQSGKPSTTLTDAQVVDLMHFLRQRINDTLRGSDVFDVKDILTGDPKAGEAYFTGDGKCTSCHSPTGDLAGIATRISAPVDVQQRMLFPSGRGGRGAAATAAPRRSAVTVTVTPASGAAQSGALVEEDDFHVAFRDASGAVRVVRKAPGVTVVTVDPMKAHHELLDRITDKNIHDLVAYLETLK